jgi:hypothetical protein
MKKSLIIPAFILILLATFGSVPARAADEGFCSLPDVQEMRCTFKKICWYCAPFETVLKLMDKVVTDVYDVLQKPLFTLMCVLFALWMGYHVFLGIAGNLHKGGPSGGELYGKFIGGAFRLVVASTLLLAGIKTIMDLTVNYVIGVGLYVANAIVNTAEGYDDGCGGEALSTALKTDETGFKFIQQNFETILRVFNDRIMLIIADGVALMKHSLHSGKWCVIPVMSSFSAGIILVTFGLSLLLRVPLRLVDAVFNLLVVCVMLPILIVAWVFPYSRGYAKKGLDMLIGVLGIFICMAVMIAIVAGVLAAMAAAAKDTTDPQELADFFSWENANRIFGWLGCLWFSYMGFGTVNDLAETMFNAPSPSIAKDAIKKMDKVAGAIVTGKPLRSALAKGGNLAMWGAKRYLGRPPESNSEPPTAAVRPTPEQQSKIDKDSNWQKKMSTGSAKSDNLEDRINRRAGGQNIKDQAQEIKVGSKFDDAKDRVNQGRLDRKRQKVKDRQNHANKGEKNGDSSEK